MSDAEADELRTRVRQLSTDINKNTLVLGEVLWKLKNQPGHIKRMGYSSLAELGEREGIGARKAQYLVEIYEWFVIKNPLPDVLDARLRRLPWTKVRQLVDVVTPDNAAEWIAAAESLSRDELTVKVKAARNKPAAIGQDDGAQPQEERPEIFCRRPFTLADTPDHDPGTQASLVDAALKRAAQLSGSPKDGHNLTLICTDFLATNDFATLSGEAKLQYLAKIEMLLGLKLIVANPDCSQVIFGGETLNRLLDHLAHAEPDVAAATGMAGEQQ
jgi:hypothetical protein